MDTIGIDLHKRESQLCIGHDDGTLDERRIATSRERFTAVLGGRPRARLLLEASTESEWVARHLEALGHEVMSCSAASTKPSVRSMARRSSAGNRRTGSRYLTSQARWRWAPRTAERRDLSASTTRYLAGREGCVASARIEVIVPRQSAHTIALPTVVTSPVARR